MGKQPRILLAEDDTIFGSVMKDYLSLNNYNVVLCKDGQEALESFTKNPFDLCILDVMMPIKDGFNLAKEVKQLNADVPIIFLTAKIMKEDMLKGYQIGADDYITKPFDSEILLWKIKAVLNRKYVQQSPESVICNIGQYTFNFKERILFANGKTQNLSPKEAKLLLMLYENKNEVVLRHAILKNIWNDDNYFTTRSMDVFITRLRKYMKRDTSVKIENLHGTGYKLICK